MEGKRVSKVCVRTISNILPGCILLEREAGDLVASSKIILCC